MAVASSRNSSGPVLRPLSPIRRFTPPASYSPSTTTTTLIRRSSVRFSLDGPVSPKKRSLSVTGDGTGQAARRKSNRKDRKCSCSPSTHTGSFRCSFHKSFGTRSPTSPYSQNRLSARRSAMTNSLVRIRGVEGDLGKRALAGFIRPSSHQHRRRRDFRRRPSRLSAMSKAEGDS